MYIYHSSFLFNIAKMRKSILIAVIFYDGSFIGKNIYF